MMTLHRNISIQGRLFVLSRHVNVAKVFWRFNYMQWKTFFVLLYPTSNRNIWTYSIRRSQLSSYSVQLCHHV